VNSSGSGGEGQDVPARMGAMGDGHGDAGSEEMAVRGRPVSATGAASMALGSVIAVAAGAAAVGALAVGALAIGRLRIGDAAVRRLRIGQLEVDELRVRRLNVIGSE